MLVPITAHAYERPTVGTQGNRRDFSQRSFRVETGFHFTRFNVPQTNSPEAKLVLITTHAYEHPTIGTQGNRRDTTRISRCEGFRVFAGFRFPETNGAIITLTNEHGPIGAEFYRKNPIGMPFKSSKVLSASRVPNVNSVIRASTGERAAVRTEDNSMNCFRMSAKRDWPFCVG